MSFCLHVVALAVIKEDKVLLIERLKDGQFLMPAGKVESNEILEEAVVRELFEETNLVVKKEDIYLKRIYVDEKKYLVHFYSVEYNKVSGILLNKEPNKHKSIQWYTYNQAINLNNPQSFKEDLNLIRTELSD